MNLSSRFYLKYFEIMDRAGYVPFGLRPEDSSRRLRGCEQTGCRGAGSGGAA